jgi:hypothetical protein
MTSKLKRTLVIAAVILISLIFAVIIFLLYRPTAAVDRLGLDVVSTRPMGEAVIVLAEQLGCIITYESPRIQDVNALSPAYPGAKFFIPKAEKFSYDYEKAKSDREIILGLINKYNETGHAREFTFVKMGEIYNVFPSRYLSNEGQVLNHKSILNIKTSLSLKDSNLWSAIEELRSAVSQPDPNYRMIFGNVPHGAFLRIPFSIDINNVTVKDVLNEILNTFNRDYIGNAGDYKRWTWQLTHCPMCGEDDNVKLNYVLNFRPISDAHPDFMKLRVIHQRPMATAVKILEKRLRSIITYEDPPYSCRWDIMGDANEKRVSGGIITMDWKSGSSADEVLNSLVNTPIRPRENIGHFDMTKGNGAYHIYPIMSRDEQCDLVSQKSIMNEQITINAKDIDGIAFVESFCSKLSEQTNQNVALGPLPENLSEMLRKHRYSSISITGKKARDCLGEYLWKIKRDISWQLLFDPSLKQYRLFLYNSSD